ncbi:MAG: hypothetical protein F6K11_20700 [Leptolyngbya sp. SIO3F4]|nr:hypothetical protein [Leptolyngbya sp. SIO3F4]
MLTIEIKQRLGNFPREDEVLVKLLVLGSNQAVHAVNSASPALCGFSEIFEWTDFMLAPTPERHCGLNLGS